MSRHATTLLALALLGAVLGACGGTLYDAAGVPKLGGGTLCVSPQRDCDGICKDQLPASCGGSGATCAACPVPAGAVSATCDPGSGGVYACGYDCAAGMLRCPAPDICCHATAVAAGDAHACAITDHGSLVCWGANDHGQIGPGATGTTSTKPIQVFSDGVIAVAAGGRHTCAVHNGAVECWGDNGAGQLGTGSTSAGGATPVSANLSGVTTLALGTAHTCALTGAGAARCWGANPLGQLGNGDTTAHPALKSTPASGAAMLSAGGDTTCAATSGSITCWGANGSGQAGGATATRATPGPVTGAAPGLPSSAALSLAVGRSHACASYGSGTGLGLWCWGADLLGQLGDGKLVTGGPTAVSATRLDNGSNSVLVSAGADFSCSAKDTIELVCSGANDQQQAGGGGTPADKLPVALGGADLHGLSSGAAFTCALVGTTGQLGVKCWGGNGSGQLGRDTSGASAGTPEFVSQ